MGNGYREFADTAKRAAATATSPAMRESYARVETIARAMAFGEPSSPANAAYERAARAFEDR